MLHDMIRPATDQLSINPIEDIPSPVSGHMFEFCDQDLFPEALQNSDVSSGSNCCYEDQKSYPTNLSFTSFPSDMGKLSNNSSNSNSNSNSNNSNSSIITNNTTNNNNNLSVIFDCQDENENDITTSMNFFSQPTFPMPLLLSSQDEQFDISTLQTQIPLTDIVNRLSAYSADPVPLTIQPPLPSVFEEDCLHTLPNYGSLDSSSPSCPLIDPTMGQFLPGGLNRALSADAALFGGNMLMGNELPPHEYEFQGESGGVFGSESVQQGFSSGDHMQGVNNDNQQKQQLVNVGGGGGGGNGNPLTSEMSNMEESAFKIGRLTSEERKEKIDRYVKKRHERNFSKKIKYACRKTLADSRPRVRGRFAKNDDFGESHRQNHSNHEDEEDEVTVKEEDEMIESSDIFAHISGVNSFKCNYPIQSWI